MSTPVPARSRYMASALRISRTWPRSTPLRCRWDTAAHARHEHDRAARRARPCGEHRETHADGGVEVDVHHVFDVGGREIGDVCALRDRGVFTSASSPPNASHASIATCSARTRSPRSAAHICESGVCWQHCEHLSQAILAAGDDADGRARSARIGAERRADARGNARDQDLRARRSSSALPSLRGAIRARPREMPFDMVDASSPARMPNTSARTSCTPLSSGAACAASSASWQASARSPAAASPCARSARLVGAAGQVGELCASAAGPPA